MIYLDVDDTLVLYSDKFKDERIVFECYGLKYYLAPHTEHIKLLEEHYAAGYTIVLWSYQGGEWAEAVAKKLGIASKVSYFLSKPTQFYDDLPANDILSEGRRRYFEHKPKGIIKFPAQ